MWVNVYERLQARVEIENVFFFFNIVFYIGEEPIFIHMLYLPYFTWINMVHLNLIFIIIDF